MSSADEIAAICDRLKATLIAKNADYADSFRKRSALAPYISPRDAIAVRMGDKISRIANLSLLQSGGVAREQRIDESIEETMLDMAGYGLLWILAGREAGPEGEVPHE